MKLTKTEFKKYIVKEVEKIALEEGWILKKEEIVEEGCSNNNCKCKKENIKESNNIQLKEEDFEDVIPPSELEENTTPKDAKLLSEELGRMKELLGFNNPLLKK